MARSEKPTLIRLNKYLADAGVTSRRKADDLIKEGYVRLNGKICREMGVRVDPYEDSITVRGKKVNPPTEMAYIAFNKPKNVVTTTSDPEDRRSVMDYFKRSKIRLFPVGRLDWATEGLLLLTNDGDFANQVSNPKSKVPKTYIAKLDGQPTAEQLDRLLHGVTIEKGGKVKALEVKRIQHGSSDKYGWVQITINEGKNRQIRKMFGKLGFDVKKLQRVAIGNLRLGRLRIGQFKELTAKDLNKIFAEKKVNAERPSGPNKQSSKRKPRKGGSHKKTTQRKRSVKK
ncbi:MAG: pseudouridylate synthase [Bdellovibrionaceae bacterium]|nr:pseudouridylate synthase [Pseudobdellovibrionaceae bacterium]|tara:strand:- start:111390 stop:112247 length:858 start_codon:yes stop_codon:yes gene_type:complete